jgi:hypothetical protein
MKSGLLKYFTFALCLFQIAPLYASQNEQSIELGTISAIRFSGAFGFNCEFFSISPDNVLDYISISVSPDAECEIVTGTTHLTGDQRVTTEALYLDFGRPSTAVALPPEAIYDNRAATIVRVDFVGQPATKTDSSYIIKTDYYQSEKLFTLTRQSSTSAALSISALSGIREILLPFLDSPHSSLLEEALTIYEMQKSPDSLGLASDALASGSVSLKKAAIKILGGQDGGRSFTKVLPLIASDNLSLSQVAIDYLSTSCPDSADKIEAATFLIRGLAEGANTNASNDTLNKVLHNLKQCN